MRDANVHIGNNFYDPVAINIITQDEVVQECHTCERLDISYFSLRHAREPPQIKCDSLKFNPADNPGT
jgi:hypothetical protein